MGEEVISHHRALDCISFFTKNRIVVVQMRTNSHNDFLAGSQIMLSWREKRNV